MTVMAKVGDFNGLALAIFAVVLAITLGITRWAARRTHTTSEFWVAGRGITGAQNGLAVAGDFLSASTFLGYAGLIFLFGFDGWIVGVAAMLSFLPVLFLLAEPMRNSGKFTVADVLSFRLRERPVRAAAAVNTLVISGIYLVAQLVGAGVLVQALTGVSFDVAVICCGVFMVVYVVFGGMLATTWVQIVKAVMLMIAGAILSIAVLSKFHFSPSELLDKAASEHKAGGAIVGPGLQLDKPVLVISTGLTIFLGTSGLPHILMRFFTVPDARAARKSVVWTIGVIGIFTVLVTFIGFGARALLGGSAEEAVGTGGNLAAPLLAQSLGGGDGSTGGDVALALFSAVAFATILAVVSGLVIAAAGAVAHDLWANVLGRSDESGERRIARIASIGLAVVAVLRDVRDRAGVQRDAAGVAGVRRRGVGELPAAADGALLAPLQHRGRADRRRLRPGRVRRDDRAEPADLAGPRLAGLALAVDVPRPRDDPDRLPGLHRRHVAVGHARGGLQRAEGAGGDGARVRGRPGRAAGYDFRRSQRSRLSRWLRWRHSSASSGAGEDVDVDHAAQPAHQLRAWRAGRRPRSASGGS